MTALVAEDAVREAVLLLQAFPDDWLDGADGPQYRALGNAVTVSVIQWIGERIMAVEAERRGATA